MKKDKETTYLSLLVTPAKAPGFSSLVNSSSDSELAVDKRDPSDILK